MLPGIPCHITQRGVDRCPTFKTEQDRLTYLRLLRDNCVLGTSHLWAALAYVERNPVRAGMVERAEEYRWSSAGAQVTHTITDTNGNPI